jgi:hypothetical protein
MKFPEQTSKENYLFPCSYATPQGRELSQCAVAYFFIVGAFSGVIFQRGNLVR